MAGGSGNAEGGAGGGHLVLAGGGDAIVLAGLVAREELLVGPAGALIHHVEVAIEVGAEFEADAIALGEHEPGIDSAPGIAIEAFEHEFHAVRAFGHGVADAADWEKASAAARQSAEDETDHWCTR